MRVADLDYALPPGLVAQEPPPCRTAARLLVVDRAGGGFGHAGIVDLPDLLRAGDVLVVNDTRVVRARVAARRPTGARLELLFLREAAADPPRWEVMVRGRTVPGEAVGLPEARGRFVRPLDAGCWEIALEVEGGVAAWLERVGSVPLPPYVRRPDGPTAVDAERYQTVYARAPGSSAAPTAGLHLTTELLARLRGEGVVIASVTLHVGPGTFRPIRVEDLDAHEMAAERFEVPHATVDAIAAARARGGRVIAVGTTTVRALETACGPEGVRAGAGVSRLFIRPGHRFRVVDALLTNFHLPRSTLLALVAAFAGWERVRGAYEEAIRHRYRFYSFGDAMLIV